MDSILFVCVLHGNTSMTIWRNVDRTEDHSSTFSSLFCSEAAEQHDLRRRKSKHGRPINMECIGENKKRNWWFYFVRFSHIVLRNQLTTNCVTCLMATMVDGWKEGRSLPPHSTRTAFRGNEYGSFLSFLVYFLFAAVAFVVVCVVVGLDVFSGCFFSFF